MVELLANQGNTSLERATEHIPAVSVGMPVYNGENYIREALDSLLAQTFTDFELIISDNASTDGTQSICEDYARRDVRIRYVRQSENLGAGNNFQYVLDHSCGKYFMWAAHDDMWAPNWLQILVPELGIDDFAVRGAIRFMKDGKTIVQRCPPNYKAGSYIRFFMAEETTMNARNFYIYGLFDRKKIIDLNRTTLSCDYYPDFLFTFKMLDQGCLKSFKNTYQIYRLHSENMGTKLTEKNLSLARLIYKVHPVAYYIKYVSIAPPHIGILMALLVPIKHIYNQILLWHRGFKKIFLKLDNI